MPSSPSRTRTSSIPRRAANRPVNCCIHPVPQPRRPTHEIQDPCTCSDRRPRHHRHERVRPHRRPLLLARRDQLAVRLDLVVVRLDHFAVLAVELEQLDAERLEEGPGERRLQLRQHVRQRGLRFEREPEREQPEPELQLEQHAELQLDRHQVEVITSPRRFYSASAAMPGRFIFYFTSTRIVPMRSMDASITSPGLTGPTPCGVPVSSTSPGCSV